MDRIATIGFGMAIAVLAVGTISPIATADRYLCIGTTGNPECHTIEGWISKLGSVALGAVDAVKEQLPPVH